VQPGRAKRRESGASAITRVSDQVTEYQRQLVEALARAKHARTEEERARHFITAEQLSQRARDAEQRGPDSGILRDAGL
jgi:hypothetical protein